MSLVTDLCAMHAGGVSTTRSLFPRTIGAIVSVVHKVTTHSIPFQFSVRERKILISWITTKNDQMKKGPKPQFSHTHALFLVFIPSFRPSPHLCPTTGFQPTRRPPTRPLHAPCTRLAPPPRAPSTGPPARSQLPAASASRPPRAQPRGPPSHRPASPWRRAGSP